MSLARALRLRARRLACALPCCEPYRITGCWASLSTTQRLLVSAGLRLNVLHVAAKQRELCEKRALEKEGWEFVDP